MIFYGDIHPIKRRKRGTTDTWETCAWWGKAQYSPVCFFLCDRIAESHWKHGRLLPNFEVIEIFLEEYLLWNPEEFDAYCWEED